MQVFFGFYLGAAFTPFYLQYLSIAIFSLLPFLAEIVDHAQTQ